MHQRTLHSDSIHLRASADQKALIDRAASRLGKSRTEFVLDTMREAAGRVLPRSAPVQRGRGDIQCVQGHARFAGRAQRQPAQDIDRLPVLGGLEHGNMALTGALSRSQQIMCWMVSTVGSRRSCMRSLWIDQVSLRARAVDSGCFRGNFRRHQGAHGRRPNGGRWSRHGVLSREPFGSVGPEGRFQRNCRRRMRGQPAG